MATQQLLSDMMESIQSQIRDLDVEIAVDDKAIQELVEQGRKISDRNESKKEKRLHLDQALSNLVAFQEISNGEKQVNAPAEDPWGDAGKS